MESIHEGLLWIDVVSPDPASIAELAARLSLDETLAATLGHRHPRHRLVPWGPVRHGVLPCASLREGEIVVRVMELVFSSRFLVTLRWPDDDGDAEAEGTTPGFEGTDPYPLEDVVRSFRASIRAGGPSGLGGFLWALFDQLAEDAFDAVDVVDDQLDRAEEVVFDDEPDVTVPRELFQLRRTIAALRRAAAPQRDVLSTLLRTDRELIEEDARAALERVYDHLLRVVELVEGQRDLLAGLLDAHLAISANRTNEVMKRTSSWGAILVVATLVVGYYGMNFASMPELGWRFGWVWALGLIVAVTGGLFTVFKKKGWL